LHRGSPPFVSNVTVITIMITYKKDDKLINPTEV